MNCLTIHMNYELVWLHMKYKQGWLYMEYEPRRKDMGFELGLR